MFAGAAVPRSSLATLHSAPVGKGDGLLLLWRWGSKLFTDSRMQRNQADDCPAPYLAFSNVTLAGGWGSSLRPGKGRSLGSSSAFASGGGAAVSYVISGWIRGLLCLKVFFLG